MAKQPPKKRGNPNFIPDLLGLHVIIEVIRTDAKGQNVKKEMTYGEWKIMDKQADFTYRAYQKEVSQYKL